MIGYTVRRLIQALIVILLMSFVLYNLIGLMPGDPIDVMLEGNPSVTPELMAQMRAIYGMDQPLLLRYWHWLLAASKGDFGYSNTYFRPVIEILGPAMVQTIKLMTLTLMVSIPLALFLGSIAARRPNGLIDNIVSVLALASISSPVFWLALLFIIIFAVKLQILPAGGSAMLGAPLHEQLTYLILPVMTLTSFTSGQLIRYVRASMIETLNADYIRTARAKGLSEPVIILRHGLRNAMLPVVTVSALSFGTLMSGALVVETMYGMLGMGKAVYDAIVNKDFNVALAGLLLTTIVTLASSLIADLSYGWLDPRVRLE